MQGRILAGRYRLEHQLGKGGMGSVWSAEHLALHSTVAVKLLDSEIARNPEAVERFQREAQAAATLRSAHVVQVLDYGLDQDTPFLVMEQLEGQDLAARLTDVGRLSPEALLEIFQQVARAVGRAHEAGIVHRDLKPENIFLVNEGDQEIVKVLDFGIAKAVKPGFAPSQTRTGVTMGTPYYMSPEQAEGKREVDHRTDLWALGVIASECLTGVRPFDGETFGELLLNICARPAPVPSSLAEVPRHFDAWFSKATHRDPAARFNSVSELVLTLGQVVAGRVPDGVDTLPLRTAPLTENEARLLGAGGVAQLGAPLKTETAPSPTTAGDVSVTVDPVEAPKLPMTRSWMVPVAALAALGALGAGGWWFTSRLATSEKPVTNASSAPALPGAAPSTLAADTAHEPGAGAAHDAASSSQPVRSPTTDEPAARKPRSAGSPRAPLAAKLPSTESGTKSSGPSSAKTVQRAESPAKPVGTTSPASTPAKPTPKPAAAAPTLRCVSDPFTGTLRPGAGGSSVPCKRNSFTGQYQRL